MKELKNALLFISRDAKDTGTPEQRSDWIDNFLRLLLLLMTQRMVDSFSVLQIRKLYEYWMEQLTVEAMSEEQMLEVLSSLIWVSSIRRELPVAVTAANVVSIFSKA